MSIFLSRGVFLVGNFSTLSMSYYLIVVNYCAVRHTMK